MIHGASISALKQMVNSLLIIMIFPPNVLSAIKPIYADFSSDNLLSRCVGGFKQNNNESYNQLVWKISPKTLNSSSTIVEIATNIAVCIFNEGTQRLLILANAISCGPNAHRYAEEIDSERSLLIKLVDKRANENTREARMLRRQQQIDILEDSASVEGLLCGSRIDDPI